MNGTPSPQKKQTAFSCGFWLLLGAFVVFASITAVLAFTAIRDVAASMGLSGPPASPAIVEPEPTPFLLAKQFLDVDAPLQPDFGPPPQPWDGQSRLTLLLLGVDSRNGEADNGPSLTDTLILVTLDPQSQTAGMLSIPRDLWVDVPNYGYHKINQAYPLGEADHLAGGGPGLVMATVENLLDIQIPYYALVDFKAFTTLIDEIGGVTLDIPETIEVDTLNDASNQVLKPGPQTLDGDLALAYARARNTPGSDFDRAARQQQVILGVREQVISIDFLPTLVSQAPALYQNVAAGVKTNLSLQQAVELAWLAAQILPESIQREVIGPDQVVFAVSYEGWDILQPIPEEILALRDQILSTGPSPIPIQVTGLDETAKATGENARIELRNGTFTVGLAARTDDYLQENHLNVVLVSNADQLYANSTMIVYAGKPYSVAYLSRLLNIPQGSIYYRYEPDSEVDILVILGEDWAENNAMP